MTYKEAKEFVLKEINKYSKTPREVMDDLSIDLGWGIIFFWGSLKFAETRDPKYVGYGNVPILVDLSTGKKIWLHFAEADDFKIETLIRNYAAEHGYEVPINLSELIK